MHKLVPIFAHRGASGYEVENTMAAFEKALKLGANGVEIDLQLTKDHVLVVFHDMNLARLTGVNKNITDCTLEELSKLHIGKRFWRKLTKHKITTFIEVVDWATKHQVILNVELKESILTNTKILVNILQKLQLPKGSHFSSFHDELMKIVKMQRPDLETAIIVTKKFNWDELSKMSHIDTVHAHKRFYKQIYFDYCEKANKKLRFYSINGNESFLTKPNPMIDGWITDYPDKVMKKQQSKY